MAVQSKGKPSLDTLPPVQVGSDCTDLNWKMHSHLTDSEHGQKKQLCVDEIYWPMAVC